MSVVMLGHMLALPVLSIYVGHAGLCPQSVGVRTDSLAMHRGKSVENHRKNTFSNKLQHF